MADSVSFKAYLKREGQEVEVRRFAIDAGAAANFLYLRGKIQAMFPSLTSDHFVVYWQDQDNDYVIIGSDEELLEALSSGSPQPFKIYVQTQAPQEARNSAEGDPSSLHMGVVCDGCEGEVRGFRYKCVTCVDFDLCSQCERAGRHGEHIMIRMPSPLCAATFPPNLVQPKLLHKFFKHQHKFHKRHGWNRFHETRGTRGQESTDGGCPFKHGPEAGAGAPTDMFDFSGLLEFLNSLGVGGNSEPAGQTAGTQSSSSARNQASANAQTQASASAQTQASASTQSQTQASSNAQSQTPGSSRPGPSSNSARHNTAPRPEHYLNGIGQAIAAFLDPFGVDVTFDVRSKPTDAQQPTPTTPPGNASTPAPTAESVAPTSTASTSASAPPVSTQAGDNSATPPAPTTAPLYPELPTPPRVTFASPLSAEASPSPRHGSPTRRNSDDWTLLNRESPVRGEEVAMDVDKEAERRPQPYNLTFGAAEKPSGAGLSAGGAAAPSAPTPNPKPADAEKNRIDDCLEKLRAMGFDLGPETHVLRELLTKENCDISTVLDIILSNARK